MPVLGQPKRVLTVFFSEIDSDFYEKNETFFDDEEGYELAIASIPQTIRVEIASIMKDPTQLLLCTHMLFLDN